MSNGQSHQPAQPATTQSNISAQAPTGLTGAIPFRVSFTESEMKVCVINQSDLELVGALNVVTAVLFTLSGSAFSAAWGIKVSAVFSGGALSQEAQLMLKTTVPELNVFGIVCGVLGGLAFGFKMFMSFSIWKKAKQVNLSVTTEVTTQPNPGTPSSSK